MAGFAWWLLIGVSAGLMARVLTPGWQASGWAITLALGLLGSTLGGFLFALIFGMDAREPAFSAGSLIMSAGGAAILLWPYIALAGQPPVK